MSSNALVPAWFCMHWKVLQKERYSFSGAKRKIVRRSLVCCFIKVQLFTCDFPSMIYFLDMLDIGLFLKFAVFVKKE